MTIAGARTLARSMLRSALIVATLFVTPVLVMPTVAGPAGAVDDGTMGIRPANQSDFFNLSVYPGAAIDATAIVSNHTQDAVTLLNYPVDAQSTPQGAFALAAKSDARTGVGGWVDLGAEKITVPANSDLKSRSGSACPLAPHRATMSAG